MLPDAAGAYYVAQQRLVVSTLGLSRTAWARMGASFDDSWRRVGPVLELVASSAQLAAASSSEPYLRAVLEQRGLASDDMLAAAPRPRAFVGMAGDGRPVSSLLYGSVTAAKMASGQGLAASEALAVGGRWLDRAMHTLVSDTARGSVRVGVAVRPRVGGFVRMLNAPSCDRCTVLAGRWYRWDAGFPRHPRCDCYGIPAQEAGTGDLTSDPDAAYAAGQVRGLTEAQDKALQAGADLSQVVNSRRGMESASSLTTLEAARGGARLTPEGIFAQAGGDRARAIELLQQNAYLN